MSPQGHDTSRASMGSQVDPLRWRNRLAFRLVVVINLIAAGVLAAFWLHDYRRERLVHLDQEVTRLREEAKVLRVAANELPDRVAFQRYVDAYCRQMERHASPGHHILVLDADGKPWVRAHKNDDTALESEMAAPGPSPFREFRHNGQDFLVVRLPDDGHTILVTQSLAPAHRIIHAQGISRAASMAVMAVLILLITSAVLWRWVRQPVRRLVQGVEAIAKGHFEHRVASDGTGEFQFLAQGFNHMAKALERSELRRKREMERARRIQASLLPARMPDIPGATVVARYVPADVVGGDYYDVLEYPDGRWLLVVADVCGHGVPAALLIALLKAVVRQQVESGSSLTEMVRTLNMQLEGVADATGGFVTCFLGAYQPSSGELEYVSAGHEPAYHLRPGKGRPAELRPLPATRMPLGLPDADAQPVATARFEPGDRLLLYTDGLPENLDVDGVPFGRGPFENLVRNVGGLAPEVQLDRILAVMRLFRGEYGFTDDVTLLSVSRNRAGQT